MAYKVIQWSTGNVGACSIRGIDYHPELELVGLWVHSEAKEGLDAGEIAGIAPTGVAATRDAEALLALDADCICYTAAADTRIEPAVDDLCRLLRAGKNVVARSPVALVHPLGLGEAVRDRLVEACEAGGTSLWVNGIDPGWANDVFPLVLTGISERWKTVRIQEIVNYATYDQPSIVFDVMGFGGPIEDAPVFGAEGVLSAMWGGTIRLLADGLGVPLDGMRESYERVAVSFPFEALGRTVEPGSCAAVRFEIQGIVDGEPRLVVEHVTRLHDEAARDWPQGHGYCVKVEGVPNLECRLDMYDDQGDTAVAGVILTSTRIVNAIPAVCQAPPGFLSPLDLPLVTGRGLMVPKAARA